MIQSKRGLLLVAALTVLAGLILTFPARIAYRWASPSGIAISGIQGTVWKGTANAIAVSGVAVRDASWHIKPLWLFTGRAVYRVAASPPSGFAEGDVGLSISGRVSLADLSASLPLQMFAQPLRIRGLQGNASLKFDRVALRDGIPVAADGTLEVSNLLAPRISREAIGGYLAEFSTQDDGISASVEDTDGAVEIAGSLQLNSDKTYQFIAQLVAKPETPAGLKRQLQYLPPANDRGQQELRIEGSL